MLTARYWVVTDLETTGLDPVRNEIIQIARIVVDTRERCIVPNSITSAFIKPTRWETHSATALKLNGLTKKLLDVSGVSLAEALVAWSTGIDWDQSVLAAWGNDFELKFLNQAFRELRTSPPYDYRTIDVRSQVQLLRAAAGKMQYLGLGAACKSFRMQFHDDAAHDAAYDALKTAEIAVMMLRGSAPQKPCTREGSLDRE